VVKNRYHVLMVIGRIADSSRSVVWIFRTTFHVIESKLRRHNAPTSLYRDLSS